MDMGTMNMSSGHITQMDVMWVLMAVMAVHHVWMWVKMSKKKKCDCNG